MNEPMKNVQGKEIRVELEKLDKSLAALNEAVASILIDLVPISVQEESKSIISVDSVSKESNVYTEIGQRIESASDGVLEQVDRLRNLSSRIQV